MFHRHFLTNVYKYNFEEKFRMAALEIDKKSTTLNFKNKMDASNSILFVFSKVSTSFIILLIYRTAKKLL